MTINNNISITSAALTEKKSRLTSSNNSDLFSSVFDKEIDRQSVKSFLQNNDERSSSIEDLMEQFRKKGFKGLFKAIEEEKIKKLREELLGKIGLTEEKLADLPPEQRAKIEKLISEEIQKRMALGSIENKESDKGFLNENPQADIADMFSESGAFAGSPFDPFLKLMPLSDLKDGQVENKEDND